MLIQTKQEEINVDMMGRYKPKKTNIDNTAKCFSFKKLTPKISVAQKESPDNSHLLFISRQSHKQ